MTFLQAYFTTILLRYVLQGNQGYIIVQDLKEILRAVDDKMSEAELDGMIKEIDQDGSGTVDFDGTSSASLAKHAAELKITLYTKKSFQFKLSRQ